TVHSKYKNTIWSVKAICQLKVDTETEIISVRLLGYKTLDKPSQDFKKEGCNEIVLFPNLLVLPEVLVSNYISTGINKLSDGSFEIDFSDVGILPGVIDTVDLQAVQAFP